MSRFVRSVLDILFGNLMLRLLGVAFTPLLVRALSKAEYGEFIGLLAVFQAINRLAEGGLSQATTKYTSEADTEGRGAVLSGSLALSTLYSITIATIVLTVVWLIGPIGFDKTIFAYLAVLVVLFRNPLVVLRGFLYGIHQERFAQGVMVFRKAIYTVSALGVAYAGFGVVSILAVYMIAYVLAVSSCVVAGYKLLQSEIQKLTFNRAVTRRIGSFGAVSIIGFMAALLLYKTDIILIRHFLGDTSVAEYQAALFPAELVWVIPGAIQGALLQNTAGDWADGRIGKVSETLQQGVKYGGMSLILFGVGLFTLAGEFLLVYFGSDYISSAQLLQILLIGSVAYGINRVYIPVLQAIGELKRQQATNVVALIINIILNLALIPRFGTTGAAFATSLSYGSVIVGSVLLIYLSPVQSPSMNLIMRLTVLFVGFVVLYAIPVSIVDVPSVQALILFPVYGGIVFAALSHTLNLFTLADLRQLPLRIE